MPRASPITTRLIRSIGWSVGAPLADLELYPEKNRLSREEALRLYTSGSAWFSGEQQQKGTLAVGQLADFAVLRDDYLTIAEERIRDLESVLTVVNGKPVYGAGEFSDEAPLALPVMPDWSPAANFGGYGAPGLQRAQHSSHVHSAACGSSHKAGGGDAPHLGARAAIALLFRIATKNVAQNQLEKSPVCSDLCRDLTNEEIS